MNPPVFHDEPHGLVRLGDELDLFQRVAVDHQKIREGARLDAADLARIGIALAGKRAEIGVAAGEQLEHAGVAEPARELRKLPALSRGSFRAEENVGAERHIHLVLTAELDRADRAFRNQFLICALLRRGISVRVLVGEKRLDAPPRAGVGHALHRFLVGELAVLDRFHAGSDRAFDACGGIGVDADIGAPVARRSNGRFHLGLGILQRVDRVVARGNAATAVNLDLARTQHQLLADAAQHFSFAVGNRVDARRLGLAQHALRLARNVRAQAEIAVAGRLRDHRPGRVDARAGNTAFVDRAFYGEGGPTDIAHGGEAAQHGAFGFLRGDQMDIGDVRGDREQLRNAGEDRVPVRVDHAGHQRAAAAIDLACVLDLALCGDEALDETALDQHVLALHELAVHAVEDIDIAQHNRLGRALREGRVGEAERGGGEARGDALQNGAARKPAFNAREQVLRRGAVAGAAHAMGKVPVLRPKAISHDAHFSPSLPVWPLCTIADVGKVAKAKAGGTLNKWFA